MRKTLTTLIIFGAACFAGWLMVQAQEVSGPMDESKVVVAQFEWNGSPHHITLADLDAAIAELPVYRQENYKQKEKRAQYLEELIDEKLKLLAAMETGLDKDAALLQKAEEYKRQLMVERITELEVDQMIDITEEDQQAYYQTHLEDYIEDAKVRATCISLTDEERAYQALEQIKGGADIVALAKELSEEGLLSGPGSDTNDPGNTYPFTRNASARWQEFIDAVFEMEIGQTTENVFEHTVGDQTYYMVFRKEEYIPERQKPFEEVKSRVERAVERQKKRERIAEWVEAISKQGNLKTYPERIPEPIVDEESEDK